MTHVQEDEKDLDYYRLKEDLDLKVIFLSWQLSAVLLVNRKREQLDQSLNFFGSAVKPVQNN